VAVYLRAVLLQEGDTGLDVYDDDFGIDDIGLDDDTTDGLDFDLK